MKEEKAAVQVHYQDLEASKRDSCTSYWEQKNGMLQREQKVSELSENPIWLTFQKFFKMI